jgi:hypothetical protein
MFELAHNEQVEIANRVFADLKEIEETDIDFAAAIADSADDIIGRAGHDCLAFAKALLLSIAQMAAAGRIAPTLTTPRGDLSND